MTKAPSLKRMIENFPSIETYVLNQIRAIIQLHGSLDTIDKLLENYGVEYIHDKNGNAVAEYSNSGDCYNPTILYVIDSETYRLTTVGDFVESWERRHSPLP